MCFERAVCANIRMEYCCWAMGGCCWFRSDAELDGNNWGHGDSIVRGEILGPIDDTQLRMHLPWMFLLIKNES